MNGREQIKINLLKPRVVTPEQTDVERRFRPSDLVGRTLKIRGKDYIPCDYYLDRGGEVTVFRIRGENKVLKTPRDLGNDAKFKRQLELMRKIGELNIPYLSLPLASEQLRIPERRRYILIWLEKYFTGSIENVELRLSPVERKNRISQLMVGVIRLLNSLNTLHRRGYAHGDIKASNIFFEHTLDQLRLGDWGIAAPLGPVKHEAYTLGFMTSGALRKERRAADDILMLLYAILDLLFPEVRKGIHKLGQLGQAYRIERERLPLAEFSAYNKKSDPFESEIYEVIHKYVNGIFHKSMVIEAPGTIETDLIAAILEVFKKYEIEY